MAKKEAGAGRGFVNPPTIAEMKDPNYVTPKMRMQMEEEARDRKMQEAADKAYKKAAGLRSGGYVRAADGCAQRGKTRGRML